MPVLGIYKHLIVTLVLLLFACKSYQQSDKLISSKKLKKDLKELIEFLEAHPDPYRITTEESFANHIEEVRNSLTEPHSKLDFYKKLASIVALLKDGHSSVSMRDWLKKKRKTHGAFPFEVHLNNEDQLYVIKNISEEIIPHGSRIHKINGISIDSFINQIDPYISYELKPFRNSIIENRFEFYLYVAFGRSDSTQITYHTDNYKDTITKNISYKEWKAFQKSDREIREKKIARGEPYSYEKIAPNVGLLHIYAFVVADPKAYDIFLLNTFKKIKRDSIHSLIIDVRGNYGGWPKISSELFHYITDNYFKTLGLSLCKVSQSYKDIYRKAIPPSRIGNISFARKRRHYIDIEAIIKKPVGTIIKEDAFFNEPPIKETFEFSGDCYLLTNRNSYSAASSFASTFQCYNMGLVIGETTGGTKIFSANPISKQLPKSSIYIRLSTTKLFSACFNEEDEGVVPNLISKQSVLDQVHNIDSDLQYTLRVIKQVQKKRKEK